MKTKTTIINHSEYMSQCDRVIYPETRDGTPRECHGSVGTATGICKKCGQQNMKHEWSEESGIVCMRVELSKGDIAEFHYQAGDDEEYDRKLIAAIKRAGGSGNGVWMDGCKNPDGNDGTYGRFLDRKMGGGFSVYGRFSVNRI